MLHCTSRLEIDRPSICKRLVECSMQHFMCSTHRRSCCCVASNKSCLVYSRLNAASCYVHNAALTVIMNIVNFDLYITHIYTHVVNLYSGTSIIQTPLVTDVWPCVWIAKIVQIIKITAEHIYKNTLSAFLYYYH